MADWDADRYHVLAEPQLEWGRRVASRLEPRAGERILDVGCGTAKLTREIADAMETGMVVGMDVSTSMLAVASRTARGLPLVRATGTAIPFAEAFDAVFSAATFHWIADHDTLFASVFAALRPGGRFVAQCGGGPNLARLLDRAHALMDSPEYAEHFRGWSDPWLFAGAEITRERLERAGFADAEAWTEAAPTLLGDDSTYREFISCVCVRHHVDRLPAALRPRFVARLAELASKDDPAYTLDYWRLNIDARRPA